MSLGSEWRKELARRIAPFYASNPHVDAVLLGGSTASGRADRYSDIEIGVFWNHPPSDEERCSAIIQVGGQVQRLYPYNPVEEVWSDDFVMGWQNLEDKASGVLVELVNYRTEFLEWVMDEVLIH